MASDGLFLHVLAGQLNKTLSGARIEKIYQPSRLEFVLAMRTRTAAYKLLLCASGSSPRVHITNENMENPANPPMLCMLFRKQLTSGTLLSVEQPGLERVIRFRFAATNELGDRVERSIVCEIMSQYGNIILLDENDTIIDSVKRVDSSKSSVRCILPSLPYTMPPPQDKLNILECETQECVNRISGCTEELLWKKILSSMQGFSPALSKEISFRACGTVDKRGELTQPQTQLLSLELDSLRRLLTSGGETPCAFVRENSPPKDFYFFPLTHLLEEYEIKTFADFGQLLDFFFGERERLARTKARAEDLFKTVNNLIERTSRKMSVQTLELEESKNGEEKLMLAQLINANLYRLSGGAYEYEVENFYSDGEIIKIQVDPRLTPSQNAQKYFKEYRKSQTAVRVLSEELEKGREQLEYLNTVLDEMNRATGESELREIRLELSEAGFIKSKTGAKNKKSRPSGPLSFDAPDGFSLLVGRTNLQNDALTFKTASKSDMWFHVQKAPGSHVVLVCNGRSPTERAMEFAACAAVYYSSQRQAGAASVDYTLVGNLKKPPGARPGYVIYHKYNSAVFRASDPGKVKG